MPRESAPSTITPAAIRALRDRLQLTQREFGRVLGCSESRVSHLEAGRYAPTGPLLQLLRAAAAGVPPQKLAGEKSEKKSPESRK